MNVWSCLDHIFIKSNLQTTSAKVAERITDHYPILLYFHGNNIKCREQERIKIAEIKFIELCGQE